MSASRVREFKRQVNFEPLGLRDDSVDRLSTDRRWIQALLVGGNWLNGSWRVGLNYTYLCFGDYDANASLFG